MQFRRASQPSVAINIAPLVDVVFLLVIFFAVSTTFLETSGLKLELPGSSSTTPREPEQLVVMLGADGSLSFDGAILDRDALGETLQRTLDQRERKQVVLRADGSARHADVVRVMDVIREAGAEALTVAARPIAE